MAIKNPPYYKNKFWAGVLLAQFFLFYIFSKIEIIISIFSSFFELQKKIHQSMFCWVPFSVGDVFYVFLIVLFIINFVGFFKKNKRSLYIRRTLILVNIIYFMYQIFWGMLYFQTPLIDKIVAKPHKKDHAKNLCLKYLNLTKESRKLVKENKDGVFSIYNLKAIESEVILQQNNLPKNIISQRPTNILDFKPSLYKKIMSFTGILGYYNPFTAEAQYNKELPSTYIPFTLAHESAHQLGIAKEQEANFTAYLLGKNSKNKDLKYSTEYFVLRTLMHEIDKEDPIFVKQILNQFSEGMLRDLANNKKFNQEHQGFLDVFFSITNDLFLKSNQQEGSITYNYFYDILLKYEYE